MSKKIVITGGSGFLGSKISSKLLADGYDVVSLDIDSPRDGRVAHVDIDLLEGTLETEVLQNSHAVINLAGKRIFGRWTEGFKDSIYKTRVKGTERLVKLFTQEAYRPNVFVSASASGFYGDRGDEILTAKSLPGQGFLAKVSQDWEQAAREAEHKYVPTTVIRNGHILGQGGLLSVLLPYYKWGLGGPLGSGQQWFPWIHIDDIADIYIAAIEQGGEPDTINAVAPETIRNEEFSQTLARTLHRPHLFQIPKFALTLLYGEFGEEMLYSQRVSSQAKDKLDFTYQYAKLQSALRSVVE